MRALFIIIVMSLILYLAGVLHVNIKVQFNAIQRGLSTDVELYDDCIDKGFTPDFCEESLMEGG